jgi:hypothetical protein
MRAAIVFYLATMVFVCASAKNNVIAAETEKRRIVIDAGVLLDGRGHVLRRTRIVIEDSKIVALDPRASPSTTTYGASRYSQAGSTHTSTLPGASARTARTRALTKRRSSPRIRRLRMHG